MINRPAIIATTINIAPATTAATTGPSLGGGSGYQSGFVIAFRSYCRRMGRVIVVVLGVVVALFGLLFALQGFGMVGGSPMSNTTTWSVLGPIIALVGIAIAVGAARRRK